jgi:maltose alpha-D-glucosyltransferase / alpha-amylase
MTAGETDALVEWIAARRWFRSKTKARTGAEVVESIRVGDVDVPLVRINFSDATSEVYIAPRVGQEDAFARGFGDVLIDAIRQGKSFGALRTHRFGEIPETEPARVGSAEQTNTTLMFGDRMIMKVYRKLDEGPNPEVEILRMLAGNNSVPTPQLLGEVTFNDSAVAIVQTFVKSRGDAWAATLESLAEYVRDPKRLPLEVARAAKLGTATAALHRALSVDAEPFNNEDRDAVVTTARENLDRLIRTLRTRLDLVPRDTREAVDRLVASASEIGSRLEQAASMSFATRRTRIHGDFHLGQVLVTPDDNFVIIDFEGEPARSLAERRQKSMPLRDVAGMLRSFDYAAVTALRASSAESKEAIDAWKAAVSAAFVDAWRKGVEGSAAAPASDAEARLLLDLYLVDKGVYEVSYELDNRPGWLSIPVEGLLSLLEA